MTDKTTNGIVVDANVLIDYAQSSPKTLKLISNHFKPLYVPIPVLRQVEQLNEKILKSLDITTIEPTFNQLVETEQIRQQKNALEPEDVLCFLIARDNNWLCLTNDKALKNYCRQNKVNCFWGIGIMYEVVKEGKLTPETALKTAQDIRSKNKRITQKTINRFQKQIGL